VIDVIGGVNFKLGPWFGVRSSGSEGKGILDFYNNVGITW
jgi:hypothetical protein